MFEIYGRARSGAGEIRRKSGKKRGKPFDQWVAVFAGTVVVVVAVLYLLGKLGGFWLISVLPLLALASYFRKRFTRWNESLTVEEALEEDSRPPIFYLRPFKADKVRFSTLRQRIFSALSYITLLAGPLWRIWFDATGNRSKDSRRKTAEEFLVSLLDSLGPVVAIGRPKEQMPPLGAARMYLGDKWKDVVHDYMKRSQLILMFAGTTTHFEWELQKVFQNNPFVPTILILPFFQRYRQSEVDRFVDIFETATGLHLSKDLRRTRAAFFPLATEIVEIHDLKTPDERVLNEMNPFLEPIAQIMELSRPGWTNEYLGIARDNHRSNWRWIFGGAAAVLLYSLFSVYWVHQKVSHADVAEQFFADLFQQTNPCADTKLAKFIPDADACSTAILDDLKRHLSLCTDPRLRTVFPDQDSCRAGVKWAYAGSVSSDKK